MLVKIGDTDLTNLVNESTYEVNSEDTYKSWQDGDFREHRVYTRSQISGSFDIVVGSVRGTTLAELIALLEANTTGHILTIAVWVNNKSSIERIEAYYSLKVNKRRELSDGSIMETVTISIKER